MGTPAVVVRRCAEDGDPAHVICAACDDPVCDVCIGRREGGKVVCRRCAYAEALSGTVQLAEQKRVEAVAFAARRDPAAVSRWRARAMAAALAGAVVTLAVSVVPDTVAALGDPPPFAYGDADTSGAPGLDRALAGLWKVRSAMDAYAAAHGGKAPRQLDALADAPQACPGCREPWFWLPRERGWEVACPTPRAHGRRRVFLDSRFGPPVVASRGSAGGK